MGTWNNVIKRADAEEIAAAEGFEWNYEAAVDDDLYEALEALGYTWDEDDERWIGPDVEQYAYDEQAKREREMLEAWNAGRAIKGGMGPRPAS